MRRNYIHSSTLFIFTLTIFIFACTSNDGGGSGGSGNLTGGGETSNGLGNAYPAGLAVESPYATDNAVEGLLKVRAQSADPTPEDDISFESFAERKEELINRINGSSVSACAVQLGLFRKALEVECYGPSVSYTNHPEDNSNGTLPAGDLGIWEELESYAGGRTQPCVIAKMQSLLSELKGQADTALDLFSAMLCYAKVEGLDTLPEIDASVDLASTLSAGFDEANVPAVVTTANITREADTSEGDAQFLSTLELALTGPGGKSVTMELTMRHIAQSTDHSAFKGRLWYQFSGSGVEINGGNCGAKSEVAAGAITYAKNSSELVYQLRRARYCEKDKADPFDSEGQLVAANVYEPSDGKGWADAFFDIRSRINLNDVTGDMGVAWQAGKNDLKSRTFVADIAIANNEKSGCGYFGFGPDVTSADFGTIEGMICNWAGPEGYISQTSDVGRDAIFMENSVQRQCVSFDAATETWESDSGTLNIEFGPTNNCVWASGTVDGDSTKSNNLFDASTLALQIPEAPTL